MEWNQRLAAARKAAGLTQEQLGELVGVTRQAVSKWEAAQAVPDALMAAELCRQLHVSADYILLGLEPEEDAPGDAGEEVLPLSPDTCPCCGRETSGGMCPACGYTLPAAPAPQGPLYAVVGALSGPLRQADRVEQLIKYCGLTADGIEGLNESFRCEYPGNQVVLCRTRDARAAQWIAAHLGPNSGDGLIPRIVRDQGEEAEILRTRPAAMDILPLERPGGLGFWGTVGAVALGIIAALILLSVF